MIFQGICVFIKVNFHLVLKENFIPMNPENMLHERKTVIKDYILYASIYVIHEENKDLQRQKEN